MKRLKKNFWHFYNQPRVKKYWPIIAILVIVFFFFWKYFSGRFIPLPGDLLIGAYFPWLDFKWGFPVGVPVKNPITSDVFSFIYPMQTYAAHLLTELEWPLWNPYILGGVPLLANFQSAAFNPLNGLFFLLDPLDAWSLQVIMQHVFCAFFTYLLLQYWKLSKYASLLGGIIFAFSGFNLIWSQWNGHALVAACIPLLLYFLSRWIQEKKSVWMVGASITLAIQIYAGYPQVVLYTLLAISFYWLIYIEKYKNKLKSAILFVMLIVLGLGLAAPQILPGQELLSLSQREVEPHPFEWAFLPWKKVITFIAPDYFGNHATGNYWGPQDYTSNTGFVGVIALSLALLGIFSKKRPEKTYAVILLITGLVLSFPTPISLFLWKSGILGFQAAAAHRALVLFNLAIALLAGFGIDSLINKTKKKIFVVILPVGLLLFLFSLNANAVATRNLLLPSAMFVALSILLILRSRPKVLVCLLLPFTLIELFYFGWKFTPFTNRKLIFPTTGVIEFLQSQPKPFRVVADHVIPVNVLMNYKIETLEGYDAVYPERNARFISRINSGNLYSVSRRYAIIDNYESELLNLANVKYFVEFADKLPVNAKVVFQEGSIAVIENQRVLPRAYFENDQYSEVSFIVYSPHYLKLKTGNTVADSLIVSDSYYPGWRAYVDNQEVVVNLANEVFRKIEVPSGEHIIEFRYQPQSFIRGLVIAGLSICALILIVWKKEL
jgi:uncharacterized membrane protein YfhO